MGRLKYRKTEQHKSGKKEWRKYGNTLRQKDGMTLRNTNRNMERVNVDCKKERHKDRNTEGWKNSKMDIKKA